MGNFFSLLWNWSFWDMLRSQNWMCVHHLLHHINYNLLQSGGNIPRIDGLHCLGLDLGSLDLRNSRLSRSR